MTENNTNINSNTLLHALFRPKDLRYSIYFQVTSVVIRIQGALL